MKKNVLSLLLSLLTIVGFSQSGIKFEHSTWEAAIKKAKSENKLIFFDAYTSWCGPCKMLQRDVFPNEKLGTYFNSNFINVKFDMEEGEGISLSNKYPVRGYPTLFFIDPNSGKIVNQVLGYKTADQLLSIGQESSKVKPSSTPAKDNSIKSKKIKKAA
ncbi:MAG: thioredoxin family protein [Leadbetterella sp.]